MTDILDIYTSKDLHLHNFVDEEIRKEVFSRFNVPISFIDHFTHFIMKGSDILIVSSLRGCNNFAKEYPNAVAPNWWNN